MTDDLTVEERAIIAAWPADKLREVFADYKNLEFRFFPYKTQIHTEKFVCAACGDEFWSTRLYAVERARARIQPRCQECGVLGYAQMRKTKGE